MITIRQVVSCLLLGLIIGGCGTIAGNAFDGPAPANTATVTMDRYLRLVSINGRTPGVPTELPGEDLMRARVLRVLPGEQTVVAGIAAMYQTGSRPAPHLPNMTPGGGYATFHKYRGSELNQEFAFTAKPKHKYHVRIVNPPTNVGQKEQWLVVVVDQSSEKFDDVVSHSYRKLPHVFAASAPAKE